MNSAQHRIIAAGVIGNVLEWYDFAIYGYFAAAIGRQFFPHEDPVAQLLSAFGVFALGYLMRPIGGACSAISETNSDAAPHSLCPSRQWRSRLF